MADAPKWIIPAPVWDANMYRDHKGLWLGKVGRDSDDTWFGMAYDVGESQNFATEAEAREWVVAEVMKALGAEVAK